MSDLRYPKPNDEYAFEDFCLDLMRDHWKLPTLEKWGRRGQRQHGVDLVDLGGGPKLRAVQCKHVEQLTDDDVEAEVKKARSFPFKLAEYWVLTTSKRDTEVQKRVRELNQRHRRTKQFTIRLKCWEDIEALVDESPAAQRRLKLRPTAVMLAEVRAAVSESIQPLTASLHVDLDAVRAALRSGHIEEARLLLNKARHAVWNELSQSQRGSWFSLHADVLLREGEEQAGARELLQAYDCTPDDEQAIANAITAKLILGQRGDGWITAERALERFPSSPLIWASAIDAASPERLDDLIRSVPGHLRDAPALVTSIVGRLDRACTRADLEHAVALSPSDARAWLLLGMRLLADEATKLDPGAWTTTKLDTAVLARAAEALFQAGEICRQQGRRAHEVEARTHRATALLLLGKGDEAHRELEAAAAIGARTLDVQQARARLLMDDGAWKPAVSLLREVRERASTDEATFLLAVALINRDEEGDRCEALRLLVDVANNDNAYDAAHAMALDAFFQLKRFDEAETFVLGTEAHVPRLDYLLMKARVAMARDRSDDAASAALEALTLVSSQSARRSVRELARVLVQLGRHEEAVPLLARLSENLSDVLSARLYVMTMARLERHGEALRFSAKLREKGIYDDGVLTVESDVLQRYNPDGALALFGEMLERNPSDHRTRVRRAALAAWLERNDLVRTELDRLPPVEDISDAGEGAAVVRVLRAAQQSDRAVSYAYDLLRRFFNDADAHAAFHQAVLFRDTQAAEPGPPIELETAAAGSAVALREDGAENVRWFVLEDSALDVEPPDEHELRSSHPMWEQLNGAARGAEVVVSGMGPLARKARVETIVSKLTFRVRDVVDQWQYRFPDRQELWMLRLHNNETGEFDPAPLFAMAKERQQRIEFVESAYKERGVPIGMLGPALNVSPFEAVLHVATHGMPVRCALGSSDERAAAFRTLESANEIVLDASALATVYLLQIAGKLERVPQRMLVPHSVMAHVRDFVEEARSRARNQQTMAIGADGPIFSSVHALTSAAEAAENFKLTLERVTSRTPTTEVAGLELTIRSQLREVLDESTLDAAAVAASPSRILWSDDRVACAVARSGLGTNSVWTQAVLAWLLEKGLIETNTHDEASARMLGLSYTFISPSFGIYRAAARLANWVPTRPPLAQAVAQLSGRELNDDAGVQLSAFLIRDAFTEALTIEARQQMLFAVMDAVAARANGARLAALVARALPDMFGLNVIGQAQAIKALSLWSKPPKLVT